MVVNEIKPAETFTLPIQNLMSFTSDFEVKLKKYKNDTLSTKENDRYVRLGSWIENVSLQYGKMTLEERSNGLQQMLLRLIITFI